MKTIAIKFTTEDINDASAIREAFHAYNSDGRGFEAIERGYEVSEYGELANTVDRFTDNELRVYVDDAGEYATIVGDVNGPWAVQIKIAKIADRQWMHDQHSANGLDIPEDRSAWSDEHDELNDRTTDVYVPWSVYTDFSEEIHG